MVENRTFLYLLSPLLDDELIKTQLLCGTLLHTLLDTVLSNEAEYVDLLGLANTVCSVHCLQIRLWIPKAYVSMRVSWVPINNIPVAIVQNNDVSRREVDAQTTSACSEQENELVTFRFVVLVDGGDAVFVGSSSIDTAVFLTETSDLCPTIKNRKRTIASEQAIIFKDV